MKYMRQYTYAISYSVSFFQFDFPATSLVCCLGSSGPFCEFISFICYSFSGRFFIQISCCLQWRMLRFWSRVHGNLMHYSKLFTELLNSWATHTHISIRICTMASAIVMVMAVSSSVYTHVRARASDKVAWIQLRDNNFTLYINHEIIKRWYCLVHGIRYCGIFIWHAV